MAKVAFARDDHGEVVFVAGGDDFRVIRRRETYHDLIDAEENVDIEDKG